MVYLLFSMVSAGLQVSAVCSPVFFLDWPDYLQCQHILTNHIHHDGIPWKHFLDDWPICAQKLPIVWKAFCHDVIMNKNERNIPSGIKTYGSHFNINIIFLGLLSYHKNNKDKTVVRTYHYSADPYTGKDGIFIWDQPPNPKQPKFPLLFVRGPVDSPYRGQVMMEVFSCQTS